MLLSIEDEKNTDTLLRFGQRDLLSKSMNRAGVLMSLVLTWWMDKLPISLEYEMDSGGVSLHGQT